MNPNNDLKETDNKFLKSQKDLLESILKEKKRMIFENNSYTHWFMEMIIDKDLLGYFENALPELTNYLYERNIRNCIQYESKHNIQYLYLDYIASISPDDVEFEEYKDLRKKRISKWADYRSLNKIYFDYNTKKVLDINTLPVVTRDYDLENEQNKFTIIDGNHRFGFAKRNNIPTIMCLVHDKYIIRKSWVEKNIEKLKKDKDKDFEKKGTVILDI